MNKSTFPVGNSSHVRRTIFETCDVPIVVDAVRTAAFRIWNEHEPHPMYITG